MLPYHPYTHLLNQMFSWQPKSEFKRVETVDLYVEPRGARRGRWLTEVVQRGARGAFLPYLNSEFVLFIPLFLLHESVEIKKSRQRWSICQTLSLKMKKCNKKFPDATDLPDCRPRLIHPSISPGELNKNAKK